MNIERIFEAQTLQEAYDTLKEDKANAILGGGVWLKQMNRPIATAVDIRQLGLDGIKAGEDTIHIGAMTTLRQLETHPLMSDIGNGFLVDCLQSIMGVALRNLATVGGSVMGRFGFSDFLTALCVLDVSLVFYPETTVSLETFLHGGMKADGILTQVVIRKESGHGYFKKNANTLLDFARLNMAVFKRDEGFRIAVGSRPGVAVRAKESMAILDGRHPIREEDIDIAAERLVKEIKLSDNNRASADYRRSVAKSYLKRGLLEVMKP